METLPCFDAGDGRLGGSGEVDGGHEAEASASYGDLFGVLGHFAEAREVGGVA
jgi:hypothetical protein